MSKLIDRYSNATDPESLLDIRPVTSRIGAGNAVRWRWEAGDVASWDNRATQHCAIVDFALQRRTLRRATVSGDAPVGIEGCISQTVRKEKAAHAEFA